MPSFPRETSLRYPHPELAFSLAIPLLSPQHRAATTCRTPRARAKRRLPQARYTPSEDDRAEPPSDVPTELTLSQQLLLKQYEEQVERMSTEDCQKLAIEIARQMMVKDNVLRKMLKTEVNFGVEPPDPDDFQPPTPDQKQPQ